MSMTPGNVALSFLFGVFATSWDMFLNDGSHYFMKAVRKNQWSLTVEYLESLRKEAIARGVPVELTVVTKELQEVCGNRELIEAGLELQETVDQEIKEYGERRTVNPLTPKIKRILARIKRSRPSEN